jgi:hypothetical protein
MWLKSDKVVKMQWRENCDAMMGTLGARIKALGVRLWRLSDGIMASLNEGESEVLANDKKFVESEKREISEKREKREKGEG